MIKKIFKKLWSKFMVWLTPILDDRKTRLAMWIIPLITLILLFFLSKKFPGRFAAVLLALTFLYWILWGGRSKK